MATQNKRLAGIMLSAALLLLVSLIAMRFNAGVNWTAYDFTLAGVLLFGTGLLCELVLRVVRTAMLRVALCAGILLALLLIWAELAVGLFGTPMAGR